MALSVLPALTRSSGSNQLGSSKGLLSPGGDSRLKEDLIVKKLLLSGTALVALAPAALAADLGSYRQGSIKDEPVYAPAFTWTGWFVGGFICFNWQNDRFGFGIEGDANAADIEHSEFFYGDKYRSTIDALYSIRGRAGFAHDRWLIFATGGWAWANVEDSVHFCCGGRLSEDGTVDGWTLGGGLEYAFTPNWTARVEYRHYDFDESRLPSWGTGYKRDLDLDTVSVGIAYKL